MGPVSYRVRSVLRIRWGRALMTAVIVAAVGGLALTLVAGFVRTLSTPDRYSAALGNEYDVSIEQQNGPPRTEEVAALSSVAAVDVATFVFGGVDRGDDDVDSPDEFVFVGSPRAFGARVVDGREPDPADPGEFVATRSWLAEAGADVGDRFRVLTLTEQQAQEFGFDAPDPEGPTLPATLVGVIDGPNELQDETPLTLFGVGLLDAGDVGVASSVGVLALEPAATIEQLRAELDALPAGGDFGLGAAEWVPPEVRAAVRAQGQGLAVVAVIVGIAAVAVVGQLLSRQVRSSVTQRVSLRAVGLTRAQVVADPACSAALPIVAGSVFAGVLAFAASGIFPVGFARRMEPDIGPRAEPLVHVLGPVVLAIVLIGWVLAVLAFAERERRARREPTMAETVLSRLRPGPAATGVRYAMVRHPHDAGSVRASVIGLILVEAVVVGALTYASGVDRFLGDPARFGSNFDFATGTGGDAVPETAQAVFMSDPDITDVTLFGTVFANVGTESLDVTGMQAFRGELEPDLLEGRLPVAPDELALGRVAARELDVTIDDELLVTGVVGAVRFRVTGLAVVPSVEGGEGIGEGALVTLEGLGRLDPDATPSVAAVRLRAGASGALERLAAELEVRGLGRPDPPAEVVNLQRVRSTPWIVAGSLVALAVLSMAHQLITATRRRRRDLAMVRALGADRRWVSAVVHWQATVVAVGALVVAIPLGVAGGGFVYRRAIDRIGARTDVSTPLATLAVLAAGLVVLANIAAVVATRRSRRDAPASALSAE